MMQYVCIALMIVLLVASLAVTAVIHGSKKIFSPARIALFAAIPAVLLGVDTFFLCFTLDTGIVAVPIVLIAAYLLLFFLYRWANTRTPDGKKRETRKRMALGHNTKRTKRFLLSSGSVALAIAAVILLNLICTNLNDRFDLNLDLTSSKMYSITQDTYDTLDNLSSDVDITVLMSEDDLASSTYGNYVKVLLDKYADRTKKLTVTYIDPYKNPSAVEKFSDLSDSVSEGSVIVQSGDQSRVLNLVDFYDTSSDSSSGYTSVSGFRGESTLTSSILSVTSDSTPHAYILRGHNESVSTQFTSMLETSGYTVKELTLAESDIPKKASLLVLSLPQKDYTEAELNALDDYVKSGGDLLVFDGTESPTNLKNLYSYLKEWGITVQQKMVLDSDYNISDARYILASLEDTDTNSGLSSQSDQVIVTPDAKALRVKLKDSVTDRTVETLLSSRKTSYARAINSDTTYDSYSKEKSDTDGPFAIAALAEYTGSDNGGQILVCSSALMMTDQLMQSSSLLNRSFLSNTISVMQPDTQLVSIASKSMAAEPLTLGTTATYVVFLILLFIPIFLFVYGIVVFFQRRRL